MEKKYDDEKSQKHRAEEIVQNGIREVVNIFHKNPFYFINEESLRCMLYSKITQHYTKPIYYTKLPSSEIFLSSPIHANPCINGTSKKDFPDLMLYFLQDNKHCPILATHRISHSNKNSNSKYRRKVWFHPKNIHGDKSASKRILIELKYNKNFNRLSEKKISKVIKDIQKANNWDAGRSFIVHLDRSNGLDENKKTLIKNVLSEDGGSLDFIYSGYSPTHEGKDFHIRDGIVITDFMT